MSTPTNEELLAKIEALSAVVEKQSKLIAQTGKQLIENQIKDVKLKMLAESGPKVDLDDYVTNDDIVQLVGELQAQLDALEERSIRRLFNVQLKQGDERPVAPLTNKDGEEPVAEIKFPATYDEFASLGKRSVVELATFYEIILPNQPEIDALVASEGVDVQQAQAALLAEVAFPLDQAVVDSFSEGQIVEVHEELARYLGLTWRKTNTW
ncbi:uncharacterized protein CANTADRAFT_8173 [Suhomyces tanzawaensis NRRL Y-17324]|uniref:Uncharacterized protein n=1 Tax=Suhomyces tanzawaensis NRRL Y-17324 TaxID=984487 RepID=A0A1E4SBY9_9ASCO|nr:uncharacterized protein CANTADRAFT_8173 [Suhomyces tanzawaensis NRRL Y-17324]ODV77005.1 hypothetical protein CANTADRAFT_8173 [Suhomyces tanzawaensis NRRL Y-17324]